jgi:hypothetical protein
MEIKLRHWNFIIIISGCLVINFSIKRAAGEADDNASAHRREMLMRHRVLSALNCCGTEQIAFLSC